MHYNVRIAEHQYTMENYMKDALEMYVEKGFVENPLLRALLNNDLSGAITAANESAFYTRSFHNLPVYSHWLYWKAPAACWGSPEKVRAWQKKKGGDTNESRPS